MVRGERPTQARGIVRAGRGAAMGLTSGRRIGPRRPSFLFVGLVGESGEFAELLAPTAADAGRKPGAVLAKALEVAMLEGDLGAAFARGREGQLHLGDEVRVETLLAVQLPGQDQPSRGVPVQYAAPLGLVARCVALEPAAVDAGLDD